MHQDKETGTSLASRQQVILRAIVTDYVRTAEPVGSETLLQRYNLGVKSATIRNDMAAMAELGYLRQPHTSAGRIPSDRGYRFYVDRLMTPEPLSQEERRLADSINVLTDAEIDAILHHACRVLSSLTRYTSLATPPMADDLRIKQVHIGMVGQGRLLVVTVLNSGEIKHRVLECGNLTAIQVTTLSNFVNTRLSSTRINAVSDVKFGDVPGELSHLSGLLSNIIDAVKQGCIRQEQDLLMEGTTHLVRQPEFKDVRYLEEVMDVLEDRQTILGVLTSALAVQPMTVVIGSENPYDAIQQCSFVAARYGIGNRLRGAIGVIGPTRMAYQHAIPAVGYVAASLSDLLSKLAVD